MYYLVEFYHVKFVSPSAAIWTISFSEKAMNFISSVLYLTWIEVRSFMCLLLWRWICVFLIIEFQGYLLSIYCKGLIRVYIKHSHYFYLTSQYTLVYFPACSIPTWILNISALRLIISTISLSVYKDLTIHFICDGVMSLFFPSPYFFNEVFDYLCISATPLLSKY